MTTIKAWQYTTPPFPSTVEQVEVTLPAPTSSQIHVKIRAAALNPVDVQLINSHGKDAPKGIGCDYSGEVIAVGSGISNFAIGDEVFGLCFDATGPPGSRALTDIMALDTSVATNVIVKKPKQWSWEEAASISLVWLTAQTALSPPHTFVPPPAITIKPSIVVLGGSSAVGIYAIQYASRELGARVVATCSSGKADFVRSLGASEIVDYTSESVLDRLEQLKPSEGYTTILDCVGGTELLAASTLRSLLVKRSSRCKEGGAYISIVGDKTGRSQMGGPATYSQYPWMNIRHFLGYIGWQPRYATIMLTPSSEFLEEAKKLSERYGEDFQIPIDSTFEMGQVLEAFERLNTGKAKGKVVVVA